MKNEMVFIKKEQEADIIQVYQAQNYYIAKLDGSKIDTLIDYMNAIIIAFKFPDRMLKNIGNLDSYIDWMRDLGWIEQYDGYILIIEHFELMMKDFPDIKKVILEIFEEDVLPFWEKEVLHVVLGGRVKGFNVYLIK